MVGLAFWKDVNYVRLAESLSMEIAGACEELGKSPKVIFLKRRPGVARREHIEAGHHASICQQVDDLSPIDREHFRPSRQ